ncbi:MAG: hypothetical protein VYE44_04395 [Verrucomicrobiota bacterium]|nr:hypothetical protein [Verrucomicrobiota bacterium]
MELDVSQNELRHSYVRGGPGAIVSGLVWLAAGVTSQLSSIAYGFAVLFFAGMLIFPISKLVLKTVFSRTPESKSNPGGLIVMETVFPMIGGLFVAWLILPYRPDYVFPIASIAVGAHYFGFRTAYGDWTYWIFGTLLCLIGTFSILLKFPPANFVPFIFAFVEILFGIYFILSDYKHMKTEAA